MSITLFRRSLLGVMVCALMLALVPKPASAQLQIKNEDVTSPSLTRCGPSPVRRASSPAVDCLGNEIGETGLDLICTVKDALDPHHILTQAGQAKACPTKIRRDHTRSHDHIWLAARRFILGAGGSSAWHVQLAPHPPERPWACLFQRRRDHIS